MTTRGQSAVIGMIFLTAIVVVGVTLVGFFYLDNLDRSIANQEPNVDITAELNVSNAIITHKSGDDLPFSELELRLRSDGNERVYNLSNASDLKATEGDGDENFEPGEIVIVDHNFTGDVRILLVETTAPGNVIFDDTVTITKTGPKTEPTIERFVIEDNSDNQDASFDVTWNASDLQGDITEVTTELIKDGVVEDSKTTSFNNVSTTGVHTDTLTNTSGSGTSYKIQLIVTDAEGNTAVDSKGVNADSQIGLRSPVIEKFDIKDFYQGNNVSYDITHNASDPDDDITDLGVTLTHEASGTEVDNVTYAFNQAGVTGQTTDTLYDPTKRQKDELYRINISVEDLEGNVISDSVTDKADGEDVSTGTGANPVIELFDVTATCQNKGSIEISWEASDSDGDLNNVTLELLQDKNNKISSINSTKIDISGSTASGTNTFSKPGEVKCGDDYIVRMTVKDETGNSALESWEGSTPK